MLIGINIKRWKDQYVTYAEGYVLLASSKILWGTLSIPVVPHTILTPSIFVACIYIYYFLLDITRLQLISYQLSF